MPATTPIYGLNLPTVAGDSGIWGGELNTGTITPIENEIARERMVFLSPTYNVGGTTTLDLSQTAGARCFVFTVSGASTIAFANVPSSSFDVTIRIIITNGSAFVLTWPASVTWLGGVAPTFKASGTDIVDMETKDGGTTWFATLRNSKPETLFQKSGLSTSSTSDVSLASFSLPAGTLAANSQQLRITVTGTETTQAGTINIKFGATAICNTPIAASNNFALTILVTRTGATAQISNAVVLAQVPASLGTVGLIRTTPAETLANAITIDFRGSVTSGGSLGYDGIVVELLAVA